MNERRIEPPSAYGKKRGKSKVLEKVVDIRSREKEKERESGRRGIGRNGGKDTHRNPRDSFSHLFLPPATSPHLTPDEEFRISSTPREHGDPKASPCDVYRVGR